jgi:Fe-S cluster biogenesis protein NfuA
VEARVEHAIERIRPSLKKRDGSIEIVSMEDGQLRLRLIANGNAPALKKMVEDAVFQAAPDIVSIAIEGAEEGSGFVKLEALVAATAKDSA